MKRIGRLIRTIGGPRQVLASGLVLVTGVLGGCVAFTKEPSGKQLSDRKVLVKLGVCRAGSDGCPDQGNQSGGTYQLLLAVRVPDGASSPRTFFSPDAPDVGFRRAPSLGRQLRKKTETPPSAKWVGYVSKPFENPSDVPPRADFRLRFGIPSPHGRLFRFRPTVGFRPIDEERRPGAQVHCGEDPYVQNANGTLCVDDPGNETATRASIEIELER